MEIVATIYVAIYFANHNVVCNTFKKTDSRGKGTFKNIRRIYLILSLFMQFIATIKKKKKTQTQTLLSKGKSNLDTDKNI